MRDYLQSMAKVRDKLDLKIAEDSQRLLDEQKRIDKDKLTLAKHKRKMEVLHELRDIYNTSEALSVGVRDIDFIRRTASKAFSNIYRKGGFGGASDDYQTMMDMLSVIRTGKGISRIDLVGLLEPVV